MELADVLEEERYLEVCSYKCIHAFCFGVLEVADAQATRSAIAVFPDTRAGGVQAVPCDTARSLPIDP